MGKMNQKKHKPIERITFLLNGFVFILNGVILTSDLKLIFGLIQILAGISNIIMLAVKIERTKQKLYYLIFVLNILVALATSFDYFILGKKYIQYVWILIALLSLITLIMHSKKVKKVKR